MNKKFKAIIALSIATIIGFAISTPTKAQERSDVYAPINCNFNTIPCEDVGESRRPSSRIAGNLAGGGAAQRFAPFEVLNLKRAWRVPAQQGRHLHVTQDTRQ